jgi:hypothetical protein
LSSAATLASVARSRQTEPITLTRKVRGELDWIVMKALEKNRARRHDTAGSFAMDVQRYLSDEPVQACPPTSWYRLRKLARRNRGRLAGAGILGLALAIAVGGVGWAALDRAARQTQAANDLDRALDRAEFFEGQDKRAQALAAFDRAELLAGQAAADPAREERLAALKKRLDAQARDQEFIARFEEIRLRVQNQVEAVKGYFSQEAAFHDTQDALRQHGLAIGATAPAQAAAHVQPSFLLHVAGSLPAEMRSSQLQLLRRTQRAYPSDLWANYDLGVALSTNGRPAEAVR